MTEALAPADDLVGRTLMGKLRVVRWIGAGGMGRVYEVEHLLTNHRRALKLLHAKLAADPEAAERFTREAGVAGKLKSPYVADTLDAGQLEDGTPYVLMELLEGQPLSGLLRDGRRLPLARAARIVWQACEGLAAAHAAGIVHRDLKPDNLFLVRDEAGRERVKILDFGISKFLTDELAQSLTRSRETIGTPYYMSPEQVQGQRDIDARSDVYSLGVVLYECLAGHRPFDALNALDLALKIHEGRYRPLGEVVPGLPASALEGVARAMHLDREQRFASARDFQKALVEHVDRSELPAPAASRARPSQALEATVSGAGTSPLAPVSPPAPSVAETSPPSFLRSPRRLGIGLALFGLLLAAGAVGLYLLRPQPPEPEQVALPEPPQQPPVVPEAVGEEPPATVELDVPPVDPLPSGDVQSATMTEGSVTSEPEPTRRVTKRTVRRWLARQRQPAQ